MSATSLSNILSHTKTVFHPVVTFDPGKDKLLLLDLSESMTEPDDSIIKDTSSFTKWMNEKLRSADARYAIGGYGEKRNIYSFSKVFDASMYDEEPRRLHLGMDIWGRPHTGVMAPLDGIVHSFAFNDDPGDFGATIILSHVLDGNSFHTLYGHLSLNSIKNLQEGDRIHIGDVFAEFGIPAENGQWPPHLHFQLIKDIGGWKGDYPGVCKVSEKNAWLANSPDPDLILKLNQFV